MRFLNEEGPRAEISSQPDQTESAQEPDSGLISFLNEEEPQTETKKLDQSSNAPDLEKLVQPDQEPQDQKEPSQEEVPDLESLISQPNKEEPPQEEVPDLESLISQSGQEEPTQPSQKEPDLNSFTHDDVIKERKQSGEIPESSSGAGKGNRTGTFEREWEHPGDEPNSTTQSYLQRGYTPREAFSLGGQDPHMEKDINSALYSKTKPSEHSEAFWDKLKTVLAPAVSHEEHKKNLQVDPSINPKKFANAHAKEAFAKMYESPQAEIEAFKQDPAYLGANAIQKRQLLAKKTAEIHEKHKDTISDISAIKNAHNYANQQRAVNYGGELLGLKVGTSMESAAPEVSRGMIGSYDRGYEEGDEDEGEDNDILSTMRDEMDRGDFSSGASLADNLGVGRDGEEGGGSANVSSISDPVARMLEQAPQMQQRASAKLDKYKNQIAKLGPDQSEAIEPQASFKALDRQHNIKPEDQAHIDAFMNHNAPIVNKAVNSVAHQYKEGGFDVGEQKNDLLNEGFLGLKKAALNFDPKRSKMQKDQYQKQGFETAHNSFEPFAVNTIKGLLKDYLGAQTNQSKHLRSEAKLTQAKAPVAPVKVFNAELPQPVQQVQIQGQNKPQISDARKAIHQIASPEILERNKHVEASRLAANPSATGPTEATPPKTEEPK
jgi:hypothetical protein